MDAKTADNLDTLVQGYRCNVCGKCLKTRNGMYQHKAAKHGIENALIASDRAAREEFRKLPPFWMQTEGLGNQ